MRMEVLRKSVLLLLFALLVTPTFVVAQDAAPDADVAVPNVTELGTGWWAYFEELDAESESRLARFVERTRLQVATLDAERQETAGSILAAISDNLEAYRVLSEENDLKAISLPEPEIEYSLDELLGLAAKARSAADDADQERLEVEREQRILDGATRRREQTFKSYLAASSDAEKILIGLRLVHDRSSEGISTRRMALLTLRQQRAAEYASATSERVEFAASRLKAAADETELAELLKELNILEADVAQKKASLRAAELAATGLYLDTEQERSQHRLEQQKVVDAQVTLALSETRLAEMQARRWWTELSLATTPDMELLEDQALSWSELIRNLEDSSAIWHRDTEYEVLAVQTVSRDGLNRGSRRLLDQRMGTAQGTLNRIGEIDAELADLRLLTDVVDAAVAEHSGAISSWFTGISRGFKSFYARVTSLGDVGLFDVGGAPVTGGDIVKVFVIMLVAFLLSRGIRHAISRVSRSDSDGTQASLYTVGRLTHYAIVIIALFVALSSIGLDFTNLALIAGALGVGIGFGLQSIVSNFVSGLIILFEHSLRVGDYIELDTGLTGTVKAINVRSTLINTNDNIDIVVPNSEFVTTRLTNWTLGERILRVRIPFGVAYGSDKELVRKAAQEAAANVPYTLTHLKGREPDVWLVDLADSSLNFLLLVWVNRQGARRPTRTRAAYLWELETKLREYGIEIPFPQRDLNLRGGWPAEKPSLDEENDVEIADES